MATRPPWARFRVVLLSLLAVYGLTPFYYLQLAYYATDVQPRVRWGLIFSALNYMIIYMPRSPDNTVYRSPILTFRVEPGDQQGCQAAEQSPPLWSLIVYMLLTEHLNIGDNALRQKFDLPVLLGDFDPSSLSLRSRYNVQGCQQLGRL
jgi:hypothetical protein